MLLQGVDVKFTIFSSRSLCQREEKNFKVYIAMTQHVKQLVSAKTSSFGENSYFLCLVILVDMYSPPPI